MIESQKPQESPKLEDFIKRHLVPVKLDVIVQDRRYSHHTTKEIMKTRTEWMKPAEADCHASWPNRILRKYRGCDFFDTWLDGLIEVKDGVFTDRQLDEFMMAFILGHKIFLVHPFTKKLMIVFEATKCIPIPSSQPVFDDMNPIVLYSDGWVSSGEEEDLK